MNTIPFEHFLLSTGMTVRIAGSYNGSEYSLNVVLMKGHQTADLREGQILKSVVGFSRPRPGEPPVLADAMMELVSMISGQTIWFGDESVKVPNLSV